MFRTKFLACLFAVSTFASNATDAGWLQTASDCHLDTITAFALPAALVSYFGSKVTVTDMRATAENMIADYEDHRGIFRYDDICDAYSIVKATDQQLTNRIWWENLLCSASIGFITSLVYHAIKHPSKDSVCFQPHIPVHLHVDYGSWAAPYFR